MLLAVSRPRWYELDRNSPASAENTEAETSDKPDTKRPFPSKCSRNRLGGGRERLLKICFSVYPEASIGADT